MLGVKKKDFSVKASNYQQVDEPVLTIDFGNLLARSSRGFQLQFEYLIDNTISASSHMVIDYDNKLVRNRTHDLSIEDLRDFAKHMLTFCDECEKTLANSNTKS